MKKKFQVQWRSDVWLTSQHAVRIDLHNSRAPLDGVVASALEEGIVHRLAAIPHPDWKAQFDAWLPYSMDGRSERIRRLEVKARRETASARRIRLDLAKTDALAFARWSVIGIGILCEYWLVPDVQTAFGPRAPGVSLIGTDQITRNGSSGAFHFR